MRALFVRELVDGVMRTVGRGGQARRTLGSGPRLRNAGVLLGAGLVLAGSPAGAERPTPCSDCAGCSALLAKDGATVGLAGPLAAPDAGVCLRITGAGVTLDGGNHALTSGGVAVRVEGADAVVRNLTVQGGAVGIAVAAADATLFNARIEGAAQGIVAEGAVGLRVERSRIAGGRVGLDLGAPGADGRCAAGATLRNPGAVVQHTEITGADVGLVACEALPVVHATRIGGNRVGLLLGDPTAAPERAGQPGAAAAFDPCVCAPSLDEVGHETTLFYSSGCGGCEVHEGWLPEVRAQGHDVRLRLTGQENKAAQDRFDAYTRRCAPAIIDAIGTPGCVPNYACVASGALFKRKGDDGRLVFEAQLNGADAVADFAARCASVGAAHHGVPHDPARVGAGHVRAPVGTCVADALRASQICGNTEADVQGAATARASFTGADNRCATVTGARAAAALGCAPCDAAPTPASPTPATPTHVPAAPTPTPANTPAANTPPPANTAPPANTPAPNSPPSTGPSAATSGAPMPAVAADPGREGAPRWALWGGLVALLGAAGWFMGRRRG